MWLLTPPAQFAAAAESCARLLGCLALTPRPHTPLVGLTAAGAGALRGRHLSLVFHALSQSFHEIDHIRAILFFFRRFDCLASGLAFDELSQRQLVLILELCRIKVPSFGVKDMRGEANHFLRHATTAD